MDERFAGSALSLIDVQRGFDDPVWGAQQPLGRTEHRSAARHLAGRRPMIHVPHHSASPGSPLRPGQPGNEPRAEAAPIDGEPVDRKRVNSAFIGTSLEADLRQVAVGSLVIVGLTTNSCVSTTARMAGNPGVKTWVVSDATATSDRDTVDGRRRPADEVHEAALSDRHGEFATVIETVTVIDGGAPGSAG